MTLKTKENISYADFKIKLPFNYLLNNLNLTRKF